MSVTFQSQNMRREAELRAAYGQGYRAGRLDRGLEVRSEYAWAAAVDPGYPGAYGQGYRDGHRGQGPNNPWGVLASLSS